MKILLRNIFNKSKEYLLLIFLLIISLSVLPLNNKTGVSKIKKYAFGVMVVAGNIADGIESLFSNSSELQKLRMENAQLMLDVNSMREYALENRELKNLLNFKLNSEHTLIPSTVVVKNISSTQGTFIINSGKKDSVALSMPVVNDKGLIGIVIESSENYAVVQNLNNSSLRISATIPRSNINGIVLWSGNKLLMKNVPTTADISRGDRVVTSSLSTIFSASIPIGLVIKKTSNISGLLSDVTIEPFANIPSVKNVFVLKEVKSMQIDSLELNLMRD